MFYHLSNQGGFSEYIAKFYFAEIVVALEYLHNNNIVYRDLKPENILFDEEGHIRIADFGLSKKFMRGERSYTYCGSPEYMCPEILKKEGHNHMVDYYTMGVLLYEMIAGVPPFYTNNKEEMKRRILEAELTFPARFGEVLKDLISKLLNRDPRQRIGSVKGMEEVKSHPWCEGIDWNVVEKKGITPPWKPKLDKSNFDPEYTQLPLDFDEEKFTRTIMSERQFSIFEE